MAEPEGTRVLRGGGWRMAELYLHVGDFDHMGCVTCRLKPILATNMAICFAEEEKDGQVLLVQVSPMFGLLARLFSVNATLP